MSLHAKLSPSAYARWMNCPGSVRLIDDLIEQKAIPEDTTSFAAEEGSAAHALAEKCLLKHKNANDYLGQKIYGDFKVTDNMAEAVQVYLDFIRGCINAAEDDLIDTKMQVEVKCSLKIYRVPGLDGGTSDTVLVHEDHSIHVIDYKHGKGVAVEIENNGQLMQYGLGALLKQAKPNGINDINVVMTIVQPRAFHPDGAIRSIEMSGKDLLKWGKKKLVPAAKATLPEDAPLIPGDQQCRWCPAKGQCKALYKKTQEIAIADFKDETFPDPRVMTEQQMIVVMDHANMIRAFISAVELESKLRMDKGNKEFDGEYKLVKGKTQRKLIADAAEELSFYIEEEQLYNKRMKGLGDIEKALKPDYTKAEIIEIMKEITTKEEGKTVIAPVSDKRLAIESSVVTDFDGLEEDDL